MTKALLDTDALQASLLQAGFGQRAATAIATAARDTMNNLKHGDLPRWQQAVHNLPVPKRGASGVEANKEVVTSIDSDTVAVDFAQDLREETVEQLRQSLQGLMPWRKGPYRFGDIHIDTEWRSDWKWQRLASRISPLSDRCVLDVGCGNGYHGWRMRGAGARVVVGVDPSPLFLMQFLALQHFMADPAFHLLPLKMEAFPADLQCFDSVFSMGVLYHRRDHMQHLRELKGALKPGGQLVLETLILPGEQATMIKPASEPSPAARLSGAGAIHNTENNTENNKGNTGRYARMRNVWSVPSESMLHQWLKASGFSDTQTIDINRTGTQEQRTTQWMPFESLQEALDPQQPELTREGWPAPTRAIVLARK